MRRAKRFAYSSTRLVLRRGVRTRRQHSREGLRYETDLTDAEWALIEPHMPKPRIRGRPRECPCAGAGRVNAELMDRSHLSLDQHGCRG